MKAIILAAGVGRRIGSVHRDPKCLLPLGDRVLLERMLAALERGGISDAVIVVGYQHEKVRSRIGGRYGRVQIRYIYNPEYEKGSILSLWAAREELTEDVIIMDADVLFPDEAISRLVGSVHRNCFLLDGRVSGSGEEMMLMARQGRVLEIARIPGSEYDTVGESVGFFKLARESAPALTEALRALVESGRERAEYEEAYSLFLQRELAGYERVDDLAWTEIDFPEDVERAERELLPLVDRT